MENLDGESYNKVGKKISESNKKYWENLSKNEKELISLKMKDSTNEYHNKVKNLLNKYKIGEELSEQELDIVYRYYMFIDKVSINSKKNVDKFFF